MLVEPLPEEVRKKVVHRETFWLPDEAASVYARALGVASCEMHSPILAFSQGTPAIYVRQPTDTRKGQMWRDVGLQDWLFEIDETAGESIAERLVTLHRNEPATRQGVAKAQEITAGRFKAMMDAVAAAL